MKKSCPVAEFAVRGGVITEIEWAINNGSKLRRWDR